MFEVEDLRDEPVNVWDNDPDSYGHLQHYYTVDLVKDSNSFTDPSLMTLLFSA